MKLAILNESRADYSICKWVSEAINARKNLSCKIVSSIEHDEKYDYVLLVGDRKGVAEAAIECVYHQMPIMHIGGGEVSLGSYDDTYRAMISQAAKYHFVITDVAKQNVVYGCNKSHEHVHVVGSPRIDYIGKMKIEPVKFARPTALVIYHPETVGFNEDNVKLFFEALYWNKKTDYIIISPNMDNYQDVIRKYIKSLRFNCTDEILRIENMPLNDYLSTLAGCSFMIGNSSAGIMETPTFCKPFVNVGARQEGRARAKNTIDVGYNAEDIHAAIDKALSKEFQESIAGMGNPFGDGKASERIADIIEGLAG